MWGPILWSLSGLGWGSCAGAATRAAGAVPGHAERSGVSAVSGRIYSSRISIPKARNRKRASVRSSGKLDLKLEFEAAWPWGLLEPTQPTGIRHRHVTLTARGKPAASPRQARSKPAASPQKVRSKSAASPQQARGP